MTMITVATTITTTRTLRTASTTATAMMILNLESGMSHGGSVLLSTEMYIIIDTFAAFKNFVISFN